MSHDDLFAAAVAARLAGTLEVDEDNRLRVTLRNAWRVFCFVDAELEAALRDDFEAWHDVRGTHHDRTVVERLRGPITADALRDWFYGSHTDDDEEL